MRTSAVLVMLFIAGLPGSGAATPASILAAAELVGVTHALDGQTLVITGSIHNTGPGPIARLVVDVAGFGPSGDLAVFGSDGIPWPVAAGARERFTVPLPLRTLLVREYIVQVSAVGLPAVPLASLRAGVDLELYRPLLLSLVRVRSMTLPGVLMVRSETRGLPIAQVTVRASLLVELPERTGFQIVSLDLDVPADGQSSVRFGTKEILLLALRVIDLRLNASWSN